MVIKIHKVHGIAVRSVRVDIKLLRVGAGEETLRIKITEGTSRVDNG